MRIPRNISASPRAFRSAAFVLGAAALSGPAFAGVIAATDFEATGSIPNVVWVPTLVLGSGVPASASNYIGLNNNGAVDVRTNTGLKPVPVGVKTKSMSMNVDFSGVAAGATSWSATAQTPLLDIANTESNRTKLNLAFDLSANRVCQVKVRIESFNTANASTGYREATVLPVAVNALYHYSIDISTMAAGPNDFQPIGPNGDKIRVSVIVTGTSTDTQGWPKGLVRHQDLRQRELLEYPGPG